YAMRAGFHGETSCRQIQTGRRGFGHAWINVQQRHTFSVDRNFELLVGHPTKELTRRSAMQQRPERVVSVRWKVVHDGNPTTRAEWRAIDMPQLRCGSRKLVHNRRRVGLRIAQCVAADLGGGAD